MTAAFTRKKAYEDLMKLKDTRIITLKVLYTIPGYGDASLETKNYIYDLLKQKIDSITEY